MNGYTYGMESFGKDEMEVLGADAEPSDLRDFLANLTSYVRENDVELHDGETIGFAADDKHTITRSPGVGLPEEQMTLKISWASSGGDPDDDGDEDDLDGETPEDEKSGVPKVYSEEQIGSHERALDLLVPAHVGEFFLLSVNIQVSTGVIFPFPGCSICKVTMQPMNSSRIMGSNGSGWQEPRDFPHRHYPQVKEQITGLHWLPPFIPFKLLYRISAKRKLFADNFLSFIICKNMVDCIMKLDT